MKFHKYSHILILLLFLVVHSIAYAQPAALTPELRSELQNTRSLLEKILTENIIPFWYPQTIDRDNGGFMLNHDINGKLKGRANKALVTQARCVWFYSRLAQTPFGTAEHLNTAKQGLIFLTDHMRDPTYGGYYWEVDTNGTVGTKPDKHLYGQAFALYAISEYYKASKDPAAKTAAQNLYTHLDYVAHDKTNGGYYESFRRDWAPLPSNMVNYMSVQPSFKLMNTHLHLLEAFTAYYEALNDPIVRERLMELIDIQSNTVVRKALGGCTDKYQTNWVPLRGPGYDRVSYGHDLENIWLLRDACDAAGISNGPFLDLYRVLFGYSLKYGFDQNNGGFFDSGPFNSLADNRKKVWWVQSEALVSSLTMFQLTGEEVYWTTFKETLKWVNEKQIDWENGDWFSTIEEDGGPSGDKSGAWKSPYHNGRSMIECIAIIDQILNLD